MELADRYHGRQEPIALLIRSTQRNRVSTENEQTAHLIMLFFLVSPCPKASVQIRWQRVVYSHFNNGYPFRSCQANRRYLPEEIVRPGGGRCMMGPVDGVAPEAVVPPLAGLSQKPLQPEKSSVGQ